MAEKEDRLSDLPDCLIHHILSFLPTTRNACRTTSLSKRWRNQWRQVPVLIFDDYDYPVFPFIIDNVLSQHECSKVEKFHISYITRQNRHLDHNIRFAISRDVKELILEIPPCSYNHFRLPEILYSHACLVKLHTGNCRFLPTEKVNWKLLKQLGAFGCQFPGRAIENILSGCPLLESLVLEDGSSDSLVIASESLRKLELIELKVPGSDFGISCPNLEELHLERLYKFHYSRDIDNTESYATVQRTTQQRGLAITSESLEKLVLKDLQIYYLEISCPVLKELGLSNSLSFEAIEVVNLQSLIFATLDFKYYGGTMEFLQQIQHAKELEFGRRFINTLSYSEGKEGAYLSTLFIRSKRLTLDSPNLDELISALWIFYALEKLVIKLPNEMFSEDFSELNYSRENYWNSSCLVHHLKSIEIIVDGERYLLVNYSEFLLENARVLEKMVVKFEYCGKSYVEKETTKVASLPRLSQNAVVEFSCTNYREEYLTQ